MSKTTEHSKLWLRPQDTQISYNAEFTALLVKPPGPNYSGLRQSLTHSGRIRELHIPTTNDPGHSWLCTLLDQKLVRRLVTMICISRAGIMMHKPCKGLACLQIIGSLALSARRQYVLLLLNIWNGNITPKESYSGSFGNLILKLSRLSGHAAKYFPSRPPSPLRVSDQSSIFCLATSMKVYCLSCAGKS